MSRMMPVTPELIDYIYRYGAREVPAQVKSRKETAELPMAMMQIGPDQGAFMGLLAKLIGAKNCLEIGVFTGYSALSVALALPADGKIVALDISKDFTDRARPIWKDAGVEGKIDLRIGPALAALDKAGTFLLASDTVSLRSTLDTGIIPRNTWNAEALEKSLAEVRRLEARGAIVLCGHDDAQYASLRKGADGYE